MVRFGCGVIPFFRASLHAKQWQFMQMVSRRDFKSALIGKPCYMENSSFAPPELELERPGKQPASLALRDKDCYTFI